MDPHTDTNAGLGDNLPHRNGSWGKTDNKPIQHAPTYIRQR